MEEDNDTTNAENHVKELAAYGVQIKKEMLEEQATYEVQIKKEMLDVREVCDMEDAASKNQNFEVETENDTAEVENSLKDQARDDFRIKIEMLEGRGRSEIEDMRTRPDNSEMEQENVIGKLKIQTEKQASDDLGINKEVLGRGESVEVEDARRKNEKNGVGLEANDELKELFGDEEASKITEEFAKVNRALEDVEGELSRLEKVDVVERSTVYIREELEMSDFGIAKEPEIQQGDEILVSAEEITSNNAQQQELKAFKAHRWLDENFNGSDSSSDDEPGQGLQIEFGQSDSETERPHTPANKQQNQKKQNLKTRGEIDLEDLPPIEKLQITVGDDVKLVEVGAVLHNVGVLVVVESKPNLPPLDAETVLFLEGKKVLGKVFDTIGRVIRPCYTVRFNSVTEIEEQGIKDGMPVFYAPQSEEWTHYVFMAHVMKIRGSDASWEHDNEPPPQFIDYSDDEAEKLAKAKRKGKVEENGVTAANESGGKRKKKNAKQQSQGFGNSMDPNRSRPNQSGEGRAVQLSSTEWGAYKPLTSWPPRQQNRRPPREPVMRQQWARPPTQPASAVQFPGRPPPMIPFPDLNHPPPSSPRAHPSSLFAPPPSHMRGAPPPPGPAFQSRPPSFSQGPPSSQWPTFQNAPQYSFTSPPPAPQPASFHPPQFSPSQNSLFHLAYGSQPQPQPPFGPPVYFRHRDPSRR